MTIGVLIVAFQEKTYKLTSDCPLLMHAGTLIDPLHPLSKSMKQISGKRKKTDADHFEMSKIEFVAGLYMSKGGVVIPADNVLRCLRDAAAKSKRGKDIYAGLVVQNHIMIEETQGRSAESLWGDGYSEFVDRRVVKVGQARVVRTRPIFGNWSGEVTVRFEDTILTERFVDETFDIASQIVGFCELRPRLGRFSVEAV